MAYFYTLEQLLMGYMTLINEGERCLKNEFVLKVTSMGDNIKE